MKSVEREILIKQASVEDANLVAVLGAVTFYEAYVAQDEPPDLANYIIESFNPDKISAELKDANSTFFIVFLDGKAFGYAKLREGGKLDCIQSERAVELQRIYILERMFGKGVGETVLNHCFSEAKRRGFHTIWLSVWEHNPRAIKFYEKFGFREVGEVTFPYGSTVGRNLVLEKDL